jgi:hypothetical protein
MGLTIFVSLFIIFAVAFLAVSMIVETRISKEREELEAKRLRKKLRDAIAGYDGVGTGGKSLLETNPHLRDPVTRKRLNDRSVISSSGVEGIKVDLDAELDIKIPRKPRTLFGGRYKSKEAVKKTANKNKKKVVTKRKKG